MIHALIAAIGMAPAITTVPTKVVTASLFKNGYSVVTRSVDLDADGETLVSGMPRAALGTLWLTTSEGTKLTEVTVTDVETDSQTEASTVDEILTINVGKNVVLTLNDKTTVSGRLESATGLLAVVSNGAQTTAVPKTSVAMVSGPEGLKWKRNVKGSERVVRVKSKGGPNSKMYILSLENGMTWAPSYLIDISDEKKLSLLAKATILNDLSELKGVELKLITGFPNVPFATTPDPFTGGISVQQFTGLLMQIGSGGPGGGGGFANRPGAMMSQNAMRADDRGSFSEAFDLQGLSPLQAEDLFFYRVQDVNLKTGDRGYFLLFQTESDYEHLYTWDVVDSIVNNTEYGGGADGPQDVWHSLKFKNTAKLPFTTGPAVTVKNGEIIGQDTLNYTSTGAEALVKITKALDIRAESSEEEVSRERGALRIPNTSLVYDLVTLKGTLEIKNRKSESVKIKVTKDLTGELISSDNEAKATKTAKGLRDVNPRLTLVWQRSVDGGKSLTLNYTFKVFVTSRGY